MSWIKIGQYLPGDNRIIQIWNELPCKGYGNEPEGHVVGCYSPGTGKWHCREIHRVCELTHVTHWAEMLDKPDDLNK